MANAKTLETQPDATKFNFVPEPEVIAEPVASTERLLSLVEIEEAALNGTLSPNEINKHIEAHNNLAKLIEARQAREEKQRQKLESLKTIEKEDQLREAEQLGCSHMNQRGEPRLGGQKLDGQPVIFCLNCQKTWKYAEGNPLPVHLSGAFDWARVGGQQ